MEAATQSYDLIVIGAGPAGQKAAVQAAKGGLRVAVCEQQRYVGGSCVQFGTIPSKALRERALRRCWQADGLRRATLDDRVSVADLIGEVDQVLRAHHAYMSAQLERNGIDLWHGRAHFESPNRVRVRGVDGASRLLEAAALVIAAGSKPRHVEGVPVDHEHVYDSDSILSLPYLPRSLTVLGGGVIACEYASVFALLGVDVTIVDRAARPLGFLDVDLSDRFLEGFSALGGTFRGEADVENVAFDGVCAVETRLRSGAVLAADKVLCAFGRVADLDGLAIHHAGLCTNARGLLDVDAHGRTAVPHIYAAGDVIGPPALASAAMEQGRRASCHLLGREPGSGSRFIPSGIYAVPELASVGLTETEARQRSADVETGVARFAEIARGQIAGTQDGFLKLVVAADGRLLGVHVAGDGATELVHMGQMALIHDARVDVFVDNVFNFPTYGESYRVAALDALRRLGGRRQAL